MWLPGLAKDNATKAATTATATSLYLRSYSNSNSNKVDLITALLQQQQQN